MKTIMKSHLESCLLVLGLSSLVSTSWSFSIPTTTSTATATTTKQNDHNNNGILLQPSRHHGYTGITTSSSLLSSSSSTTRLQVATSTETENMPELGSDGVYHIMNEAQHRALLDANKDKLVIMKVFAPWCRACKGLEPKFNAIVKDKKYNGLPLLWADLTIAHNKEYVKRIGVLALPTIQFYAHGQIMDTFACGPSKVPILKRKLAQFINQNIDASTYQVKSLSDILAANETAAAAEAKTNALAIEEGDEEGESSSSTAATSSSSAVTSAQIQSFADSLAAMTKKATSAAPEELTVDQVVQKQKSNLRRIPYFSGMLESEFDALLSKANLLTFEGGSIIMKEGNSGRTFYYIVEGDVEICQRTSFEDPLTTPPTYLGTVINRFEKGEYFGERALITGEPRAASIRASGRTLCLSFDKDDFPASCVLSGKAAKESAGLELQNINDKYGVALSDMNDLMSERLVMDSINANQMRGSVNNPQVIDGVDNDNEIVEYDDEDLIDGTIEAQIMNPPSVGTDPEVIVPLLMRFKLIRLVTRCFDYIVSNRPSIGDTGAQRRRARLINLLSKSQRVDFTDAYKLIDKDGDGVITLLELRRLMDSIGEEKSDEELEDLIKATNLKDGKQVLSYQEFMGLMAEVEFYNLFTETFRALDKQDSGFVRAKDLDRVLCGVRDLITADRRSIIDVEDTDMMVDYEQFSRMLLGTALK